MPALEPIEAKVEPKEEAEEMVKETTEEANEPDQEAVVPEPVETKEAAPEMVDANEACLLYTSPSPRDRG